MEFFPHFSEVMDGSELPAEVQSKHHLLKIEGKSGKHELPETLEDVAARHVKLGPQLKVLEDLKSLIDSWFQRSLTRSNIIFFRKVIISHPSMITDQG